MPSAKPLTLISLAFSTPNNYEFNTDGNLKDLDFAYAYYEWDTQYQISQGSFQREFVECDSLNKYIIYKLFNDKSDTTYFRVGTYNNRVSYVYTINATDKLTVSQEIDLLKGIRFVSKQKRKNKKNKKD